MVAVRGVVLVPEFSSWSVVGGGYSFEGEFGIPALSVGSEMGVSAGAGGVQVDFASARQDPSITYRATFGYIKGAASIGGSLLGEITITGGVPQLPAGGTAVLRQTGAVDDRTANGPPSGFLGPAYMVTGNIGIGNVVEGGLLAMRPPPSFMLTNPVGLAFFNYFALVAGVGISSSASAGINGKIGVIFQIDKYENGSPTNQQVNPRGGLMAGPPFTVPDP